MADGWTDVRQRTLINFLVYSTHGMVFVKSVDASDLVKDAKTLFTLFCEVIEWIGPKNIVHVVTDNAANYVACDYQRLRQGKILVIILDNRFWNDCYQVVKIVSPLIKLLRIVDSDEKPSLPYVYEGMRREKIAIKEMFKKNKELYKPYTRIIQTRWDRHLKTNLHAASYLLNPAITYGPDCPSKSKLMMALIDVVESYSDEDIDGFLVMKQATTYREDEWWTYYGCSVPELQRVAMRILSQTSASSGCERNWSLFERIHTKRRNRLEHKRLNDLVFTNYNLRLKHRSTLKKSKSYDPIDYENIDMVDFWVAEEDPTPEFDDRDVDTLESVLNNDGTANSTTLESANEGDEDMNIADPPPLQDDVVAPAFPCPAVDISAHANDLSDDFDFP
ncbi:uncharacterized protein LOC114727081 [Neltuma alba]|uniref:uncharacterized protein LOC114727081 n=1 Tax=Neltuma alba TaxID=207710 RepID=UPI0010A2EBA8|nr:uncharacterized protein LOC114727081 [Prosopis alba]